MTVRCIDIETTGTDPAHDAIIEIASVDLQRDGTITTGPSRPTGPRWRGSIARDPMQRPRGETHRSHVRFRGTAAINSRRADAKCH